MAQRTRDTDSNIQEALSLKIRAEVSIDIGEFSKALQDVDRAIGMLDAASGGAVVSEGMILLSDRAGLGRDFWQQVAFALDCRGRCLRHLGQSDRSIQDSKRALVLLRVHASAAQDPDDHVAVVLHNLGNAMLQMATPQSLALAHDAYSEAIEVRRRLRGLPGQGHVIDDLAGSLKARASVQMVRARSGRQEFDLGAAEGDLLEALELRRYLVEEDGQKPLAPAYAMTQYALADLYGMGFFFEDACDLLDQAVETMRSLVEGGQTHRRWELALCLSARVLYGIGAVETGVRSTWPVAEALECAALYQGLLGEGRLDQVPAFFEFVNQRALPCLVKGGQAPNAAGILHGTLRWIRSISDASQGTKLARVLLAPIPPPALEQFARLDPRITDELRALGIAT